MSAIQCAGFGPSIAGGANASHGGLHNTAAAVATEHAATAAIGRRLGQRRQCFAVVVMVFEECKNAGRRMRRVAGG